MSGPSAIARTSQSAERPNLGHWSNKAALLKADIKAIPRMVAATGNDLGWLLYEAQFSFGSPRGVAQRYALIEVGGND